MDECIRRVREAGYEVTPQLLGLGEFEGIRDIFLEHLEAADKECVNAEV